MYKNIEFYCVFTSNSRFFFFFFLLLDRSITWKRVTFRLVRMWFKGYSKPDIDTSFPIPPRIFPQDEIVQLISDLISLSVALSRHSLQLPSSQINF